MTEQRPGIGRFAPSPTGPLHFGSLVAALGSYLQARSRQGQWQLRIEDIDPPREVAGSADTILRTLEALGFQWDGPVQYQSARLDAYAEAIDQLRRQDRIYACSCSRQDISRVARTGLEGAVYPGTCRRGPAGDRPARALRILTDNEPIRFHDALQGPQIQQLEADIGDFVLRRADGCFSYQLAVVVDDAHYGVTEVVRGTDLLLSTARQIHLQRLLALPTPDYVHLPIAVNNAGEKLSKQTGATAVKIDNGAALLSSALTFLGHPPPATLADATTAELWAWALPNWDLRRVPVGPAISAPE